MADEEKPEVDGEGEGAEAPKKGGMLLIVAVAVLMGGAGFFVPFLVPSLAGGETEEKEEPKSPIPEIEEEQEFIQFGEVTVNLDEARLNRYLRTTITLQVDSSKKVEIEALIEKKKASIKNWMLGFFADKDMDQIRGAAGQNRIRRQIQDHLNSTLWDDGYDRIHDVLFEEFNVQ